MVAQEYEFKVGDIVKIRKDSKYYGEDADSNPANILGDVVKVCDNDDPGAFNVSVVWKTGCWNSYTAMDLELAEIGEQKDSIREIRDRIYAIDAELKSLQEEREKLVEVLREEGLVLLEKCKEPELDMTDWRNWKVGDIVEVLVEYGSVGKGKYKVKSLEDIEYVGMQPVEIYLERDEGSWPCVSNICWHSRPKA